MIEAAFWRENSASEEDFVRRRIEDGRLEGEARRKSCIDRDLPDKGIFPEHREEVGVEYLEEGGSRIGWVEQLGATVLSERCVLAKDCKGRK